MLGNSTYVTNTPRSWKLLAEREREVFQGLSIFRGGFTRDAAQEVTGASLRDLMALVNKSLLQRTATGRYDMHEVLRGYAAEKLATSEMANVARDAHSAYFAEFLHQREADLKGRRQLGALDEIEADFENVRAAWNWALEQKNCTVKRRATFEKRTPVIARLVIRPALQRAACNWEDWPS